MNRVKQIGLFIMAIIFSNVISAQEAGKTQEEVKKASVKSEKTTNEESQHKMGGRKTMEQQMNQLELNGEVRPKNIKKLEERMPATEEKENMETSEEMKPMTDEQAKLFEEKKKQVKNTEKPNEVIPPNTISKTEDSNNKAVAKVKTKKSKKAHLKNGGKKKKGKVKKAVKAAKRK